MVPDGWQVTTLGKLFKSRREKGVAGLPTLSVTINDGLVFRESLERKTETKLSPEEHLLARKGDIAYNMMRMWQGASGLAHFDAIVSPAYVVLQARSDIDPLFASYLLKSPRMIYLLWAYSYGLTKDRLRLYFPDFSLIPVALPPKVEQRKIAEILLTWDLAIEATNKLIQNSQKQNQSLMGRLFGDSARFSEFAGQKWTHHTIGHLGTTYAGLSGKTQKDFGEGVPYIPYLNIFENPRIDLSHVDRVTLQPGEKQNRVQYGDVFFTTSSETPDEVGMSSVLLDDVDEVYLNSFCFGFRLHCFDVLTPEFARFLFRAPHVRKSISYLAQGATRHNLAKSQFLKLSISIPSVQEQSRIARCLVAAEEIINKEKAAAETLRAQKKALMQRLLTGKYRVLGNQPKEAARA